MGTTDTTIGQTPYLATTVFNFYTPDYSDPGTVAAAGLFSPELAIIDETTVTNSRNTIYTGINSSWPNGDIKIDLTNEANTITSGGSNGVTNLLNNLNVLLMAGQMPSGSALYNRINTLLTTAPLSTATALAKAQAAVEAVAASAQFATQK